MMKKLVIVGIVVVFVNSPDASASYQMFCELDGTISSAPIQSDNVQFEFYVESAREVELEVIGRGEPDCHLYVGKKLAVILALKHAGDRKQLVEGARILLERYDIDVVNRKSGAMQRQVKYVRKDI